MLAAILCNIPVQAFLVQDPRYLVFEDWARQTSIDLFMEYLPQDNQWQTWGAELIARNNFVAPSPYQFDDWRECAFALMTTVT
jgi:hypothetical protein